MQTLHVTVLKTTRYKNAVLLLPHGTLRVSQGLSHTLTNPTNVLAPVPNPSHCSTVSLIAIKHHDTFKMPP